MAESPSTTENCRFTRSMARTSETGACLTDLLILNAERVIRLTMRFKIVFIYFSVIDGSGGSKSKGDVR